MTSLRSRIFYSFIAAALVGAAVAALSFGSPLLTGWLGASLLSFIAIVSLVTAWKWAGGGKKLAWMVGLAFTLRLGLGILLSLGVQVFGYQNEPVQHSGYIYADAFTRDNDAWNLAQSGQSLLVSFSQEIVSDQYGGSLALSALIYRALSPDAHRRFLILILSAFIAALGVPFFWQAVRQRWDERLAGLATWILALYPESVILGGSQLREPYLIGLTCVAFWATLSWRSHRRPALLAGVLSMTGLALLSWRAAAVVAGMLVICAWLDGLDGLRDRLLRLVGWAVLAVLAVGAVYLSWGWMQNAAKFDTGLTIAQSGMVQKIVSDLGESFRTPFVTAYGLAQPVLPAVLVEPSLAIWQGIGLLRALGWYALAPFFLYALLAAFRAQPKGDRRLLVGMGLMALVWIFISSARAGGDQWDNPRYRTIVLPWLAILAAWGWNWARQKQDIWVWAFVAADGIFSLIFLGWYELRFSGSPLKPPFVVLAAGVLVVVGLMMGLFWLLSWRRGRLAAGKPADLRAEARRLLALGPARPAPSGRRVNRWDLLAAATFLGFALLYFLGRLQGNFPVVILGGDAGNIASYAAALDHPAWFQLDPVLGNLNNIGVYATIHLPLIRALEPLAGDYALAYTWLLIPHIFLQLLGFYILGRVLFKNRLWATLLAWITAMMVIDIGLGEVWGVWRDALPRVTFQTLLPYLLVLAVLWRDRPRRWPWLMVGAGLLVYAHPVSAPGWGFALWLGMWMNLPKDWRWGRRIGVMLGLGGLFLLPMVPFALNYLSYRTGGGGDYATLMPLMLKYFPENLLNVPAALLDFVKAMSANLLIPLGLIGMVVAWLCAKDEHPAIKLVLAWLVGIFVVSILVPFGERTLEATFKFLPLETELLRGIRYFVPLLLIFWLWPLSLLTQRLADPQARRGALALGIVLFGFWSGTHLPDARRLLNAATCLAQGHLVCEADRDMDEMLLALRSQTQPGDGIFVFNEDDAFTSNSLSVRYSALRAMVHSPRDQGILGYAQPGSLVAWDQLTTQIVNLRAEKDVQTRLAALLPIAKSLKASYVVIDFGVPAEGLSSLPVKVILKNDTYTLLELTSP